MISAKRRPLTGAIEPALILLFVPVTVQDHLLHAWASLVDATQADGVDVARHGRAVSYARNRADSAEALFTTLRDDELEAARAELYTLRDEIHYT